MGACIAIPKNVYIVKENERIICCSYDFNTANTYFRKPLIPDRVLIELHPDTKNKDIHTLVKHTYPFL